MNLLFDKLIIFRFFEIFVITWFVVGIFFANQSSANAPQGQSHRNTSIAVKEIDRQVDTVLTQFRIENNWCRKRDVVIPGTNLNRVERKVLIPPDIIPVQMNQAFNLMAQRYGGRAVGSENIKENTVTIHIKLEGYIIETIILKTSKDLKRVVEKKQQRKI
jgi:hypothetical protein